MRRKRSITLGGILFAVLSGATVGLAQTANFGSLTLSSQKPTGSLAGAVGGSTSLPAIISNVDRHNNRCLGFGDPSPDHILVLQQDFSRLSLRVNSGGTETTLVIQGPDGVVRCGAGGGGRKDASLADTDWKAGRYKVWVGSLTPGVRRDYTLLIR